MLWQGNVPAGSQVVVQVVDMAGNVTAQLLTRTPEKMHLFLQFIAKPE
jgi:hypothetical protein